MTSVCPLVIGQHPLEIYEEVLEQVGDHVMFESMAELDFGSKFGWFKGQIVEVQYNKTGGYVFINVEDESNIVQRIKIDSNVLKKCVHVVDKGYGACVVVACLKHSRSKTLKCALLVDLEDVRQDILNQKEWSGQAIYLKKHPVILNEGKNSKLSKLLMKRASKYEGVARDIIAWVISVKEHFDKNGNLMCFFDLAGYEEVVSGVCFSSSYEVYKGILRSGTVVKIDLKRGRGRGGWFLEAKDGCKLKVLSEI